MPRSAVTTAPAATSLLSLPADDPVAELDRQLATLIELGLPADAGVTAATLRRRTSPLRDYAAGLAGSTFVLVLPGLLAADRLVTLTRMGDRPGFTSMDADDLASFRPTKDIELPAGKAYLLVDVETGHDSLNIPPEKVLPGMLAAGRTPLTLDEGLALLLQDGGVLRSETCFSMLGSRCGDRRVPALWVSERRPRLGWCWDGAPHTWLGSASAAARVG